MDVRTDYQFCQDNLFCTEDENTFEYIQEALEIFQVDMACSGFGIEIS